MNYYRVRFTNAHGDTAEYVTDDPALAAIVDPSFVIVDDASQLPPLPTVERQILVLGLKVYYTSIISVGHHPSRDRHRNTGGFSVYVPALSSKPADIQAVKEEILSRREWAIYRHIDLDAALADLDIYPAHTPIDDSPRAYRPGLLYAGTGIGTVVFPDKSSPDFTFSWDN